MGVIIFIIVMIVGFVLLGTLNNAIENTTSNNLKERNLLFEDMFCKYLGGYPDIEGGKTARIGITNKNYIIMQIGNNTKNIKINDVINAEIMSEQSISQSVSLGKMVMFGVFALGMKNQKTIVKNYLVLTHKESGKDVNVIIESKNLEKLTREIRKLINK